MNDPDARIAVLENELGHTSRDLNEFFEFVRKHMEQEKKDRTELLGLLQDLKTRVERQTFFASGVAFTLIVVWTIFKFFVK